LWPLRAGGPPPPPAEKDKNFEDVTGFMLQLPTFQYHNKTWKWVDFWTQGKKGNLRWPQMN